MIKVIFVLVVVLALNASANDNQKKMECIKKKYSDSLENFSSCTERGTKIPVMKRCYQDEMLAAGVVLKANNGQMTVSYDKFGEYGQRNSHAVGKAMKECHKQKKDDDMYKEAARATQCVFEKLKNTC